MLSLLTYIITAANGFMLAFLYKKTFTTANVLSPDPKRILRIFLTIFISAVVIIYGLSWYATYSLRTAEIPEEGRVKFESFTQLVHFLVSVAFFVLVLFSNILSQTIKKIAPVPYLLAALFYALFTLKASYHLNDYYLLWQKSLNLLAGPVHFEHSNSWFKAGIGLGVTGFNVLITWWSLRK